MNWSNTPSPSPLGIPLDNLRDALEAVDVQTTRRGNELIAQVGHCSTRIEVLPPALRDSANGPIKAVIQVVTDLPAPLLPIFQGREASAMAAFNAFASLGALYREGTALRIGSRLTVYEVEDVWDALHLPLLVASTLYGSAAVFGGIRRVMTNEASHKGRSRWTAQDFMGAQRYLDQRCVCTADGLGFTAEFGLAGGTGTAMAGDTKTALFQLLADEPHLELGGGLFCLLQMPHRVADTQRLQRLCNQLNHMEMAPHDLPPHLGAWCPGRLGSNPAYVSFLPNELHELPGLAVNTVCWVLHRAQWADALLASLGVSTEVE